MSLSDWSLALSLETVCSVCLVGVERLFWVRIGSDVTSFGSLDFYLWNFIT